MTFSSILFVFVVVSFVCSLYNSLASSRPWKHSICPQKLHNFSFYIYVVTHLKLPIFLLADEPCPLPQGIHSDDLLFMQRSEWVTCQRAWLHWPPICLLLCSRAAAVISQGLGNQMEAQALGLPRLWQASEKEPTGGRANWVSPRKLK